MDLCSHKQICSRFRRQVFLGKARAIARIWLLSWFATVSNISQCACRKGYWSRYRVVVRDLVISCFLDSRIRKSHRRHVGRLRPPVSGWAWPALSLTVSSVAKVWPTSQSSHLAKQPKLCDGILPGVCQEIYKEYTHPRVTESEWRIHRKEVGGSRLRCENKLLWAGDHGWVHVHPAGNIVPSRKQQPETGNKIGQILMLFQCSLKRTILITVYCISPLFDIYFTP